MGRVYQSKRPCPFCGGRRWRAYRVTGDGPLRREKLINLILYVDGFRVPRSEAKEWGRYHLDECIRCRAVAT